MQPDDSEILSLFQQPNGREAAFTLLLRKYQQRVYWHVRKMVIDHDDADDLTQDTFIKAWNNLDKFRQESKIFTWLYRIATNECLNFLEKKKRRQTSSLDDLNHDLVDALDSSPYVSGDAIQLKLQKAILTLPEKQRLVFNMRYFEEMKYEEISEVLGTSVGALKANYHHAVKKVEEYMKRD